MITRRALVGLAPLALSGISGTGGGTRGKEGGTMRDDEQVAAAIQDFVAAYNAADLKRLIGHYSDDLIKDRQGAPAETKAQTADRIEQVFREYECRLSVSNDEIVTCGDLAYTRGSLRIILMPRAGGPPRVLERRFLEIWRKQAGTWRVCRTMDNSAAPPA